MPKLKKERVNQIQNVPSIDRAGERGGIRKWDEEAPLSLAVEGGTSSRWTQSDSESDLLVLHALRIGPKVDLARFGLQARDLNISSADTAGGRGPDKRLLETARSRGSRRREFVRTFAVHVRDDREAVLPVGCSGMHTLHRCAHVRILAVRNIELLHSSGPDGEVGEKELPLAHWRGCRGPRNDLALQAIDGRGGRGPGGGRGALGIARALTLQLPLDGLGGNLVAKRAAKAKHFVAQIAALVVDANDAGGIDSGPLLELVCSGRRGDRSDNEECAQESHDGGGASERRSRR